MICINFMHTYLFPSPRRNVSRYLGHDKVNGQIPEKNVEISSIWNYSEGRGHSSISEQMFYVWFKSEGFTRSRKKSCKSLLSSLKDDDLWLKLFLTYLMSRYNVCFYTIDIYLFEKIKIILYLKIIKNEYAFYKKDEINFMTNK